MTYKPCRLGSSSKVAAWPQNSAATNTPSGKNGIVAMPCSFSFSAALKAAMGAISVRTSRARSSAGRKMGCEGLFFISDSCIWRTRSCETFINSAHSRSVTRGHPLHPKRANRASRRLPSNRLNAAI